MFEQQEIAELGTFVEDADRMLNSDEFEAFKTMLSMYPKSGDLIPGGHGLRKIRIAAKGKGKRGGARVIYYYYNETKPLYLLALYGKNEKVDLSQTEKKAMVAFVKKVKGI